MEIIISDAQALNYIQMYFNPSIRTRQQAITYTQNWDCEFKYKHRIFILVYNSDNDKFQLNEKIGQR